MGREQGLGITSSVPALTPCRSNYVSSIVNKLQVDSLLNNGEGCSDPRPAAAGPVVSICVTAS